jgi:DNA-binding NarL/FixJ family response regulator
MSLIRILVVDDFEPWRSFVASTLQKRTDLRIVFEASDGLQAVHKAEQLQPELILLDIGLPSLNGIEAARRIRGLAPRSQIIFLSENYAPDIAQAALDLGARGYVVKTDAGSDLLRAIQSVVEGKRFVSMRLAGQVSYSPNGEQSSADLDQEKVFAQLSSEPDHIPRHEVQLYPDDVAFLEGFTNFISAALEVGNAVIVVATEAHRVELLRRLRIEGVNIDAALKEGTYIPLDVQETLSRFMVDGLPDPERFRTLASSLFRVGTKAAKGKNPRLVACGECAPSLWLEGNAEAAIRLEALWDEVGKAYGVDILCGYLLVNFRQERGRQGFSRICEMHSAVIPRDYGDRIA